MLKKRKIINFDISFATDVLLDRFKPTVIRFGLIRDSNCKLYIPITFISAIISLGIMRVATYYTNTKKYIALVIK
jgi:hypothetical protein